VKCINKFREKTRWKTPLGRPSHRWERRVKEIGPEGVNCIPLAQDGGVGGHGNVFPSFPAYEKCLVRLSEYQSVIKDYRNIYVSLKDT
jgi:hypothetical protein